MGRDRNNRKRSISQSQYNMILLFPEGEASFNRSRANRYIELSFCSLWGREFWESHPGDLGTVKWRLLELNTCRFIILSLWN